MSVVLLVRHAQASFGLGAYDRLSDHGRAQARRVAEVLAARDLSPQRIVCGELQRQQETAGFISAALGDLPVEIDSRWNEYDHEPLIARVKPMYRHHWVMVADLARSGNPGGRFQDLLDRALAAWVDDAADGPGADTSPAESFTAYTQRITGALDDVSSTPGLSIVVSSAGSIAAAAAPLLGVAATGWPALQRVIVNASVSKLVRGRRGITLVSFNEHGHLEGVPGLAITYR